MTEEGLVGSRYTGQIDQIKGDQVLVRFDEFYEDEAGLEHLKEWTDLAKLRPPPPPTPPDFFRLLRQGAQVDLFYEDGWWDAELLKKRRVEGGQELLLRSVQYLKEHWVKTDAARPHWVFKSNCWRIEGSPDTLVLIDRSGKPDTAVNSSSAGDVSQPRTKAPTARVPVSVGAAVATTGGAAADGQTWSCLSLSQKLQLVLDWNPSAWQPLGIDAYLERLAPLQKFSEAVGEGLDQTAVDAKLYEGAFAQGWRVHCANRKNDGHFHYFSPDGQKLVNRATALAWTADGLPKAKSKRVSARYGAGDAATAREVGGEASAPSMDSPGVCCPGMRGRRPRWYIEQQEAQATTANVQRQEVAQADERCAEEDDDVLVLDALPLVDGKADTSGGEVDTDE